MNTTDKDRNRCEAPEQAWSVPDDADHDPCEVLQQPVPDNDNDLPAAKKARLEGPTSWQRIIAWLPWLSGQG